MHQWIKWMRTQLWLVRLLHGTGGGGYLHQFGGALSLM
eukprot:COSAG06_NODE_45748_length_352_cov_0.909091_1_plen_37_part_10